MTSTTDTEAFEILANEDGFDDRYTDRIMANVVKAQKLALVDEYESGILEAFTT